MTSRQWPPALMLWIFAGWGLVCGGVVVWNIVEGRWFSAVMLGTTTATLLMMPPTMFWSYRLGQLDANAPPRGP